MSLRDDLMLYELAEEAKREISKYSDDYEIYLSSGKVLQLDSQKTDLNFAKEEFDIGLGIRVIKDGRLGFAFTSDVSRIAETAENAYSNSKLNVADEYFSFAVPEKLPVVKNTCDNRYDDLELDEIIESLKSVLAVVEDNGCQVSSGVFSSSYGENLIVNSNGVEAFDKGTGFGIGVSINAIDGDELSTAYDSVSSNLYDLDGEKLALEVCDLAKSSLGGEHIETGDMDVVFDYYAAIGLLSNFLSGFSAENIQRGRSKLIGKTGEKITTENLSIYDDGTLDGGLSSGVCDGEGTASKRTTLVEDGVLKGFLYDIYTANKDGVESTSNGFRGSYAGIPSVGSSNVIFDFKNSIDISEIDSGFLTTSVLGAHTANPITGDFSVECSNAFAIENGEIAGPVKKAMMSGNIYDILSNCDALKSEVKQKGSFILPKVFARDVRVVGN